MKKYIDAERLIVEVEALKRRKGFLPFENTEITEAYMARGVQFTCDDVVNLIQSIRQDQPEVDLQKEIEWEWVHREKQEVDLIECAEMDKEEFARFARLFYELGLDARKEE